MKSFLTAPRLLQDTDGNQVRADQIAGPNGQLLPARDYDEEPTAPPPKAKTPCPADGCCESFTSVGNLANHVLLKHPGARLSVCLSDCLSDPEMDEPEPTAAAAAAPSGSAKSNDTAPCQDMSHWVPMGVGLWTSTPGTCTTCWC